MVKDIRSSLQKKTSKWPVKYTQGARYQYSSEKSKLKPQFIFPRIAHMLLLRMINSIVVWNTFLAVSNKAKHRPTLWDYNSSPRYMPKTYKCICKKEKKRRVQESL